MPQYGSGSDGGYVSNPQIARMRERAGKEKTADHKKHGSPKEGSEHEERQVASHVETHKHEDGSGFKTIAHHHDGSSDEKEHATLDEAQQHERQAFGEDGDPGDEQQDGQQDQQGY
jgi:hypothetical protein